jgi:hypothetical protein
MTKHESHLNKDFLHVKLIKSGTLYSHRHCVRKIQKQKQLNRHISDLFIVRFSLYENTRASRPVLWQNPLRKSIYFHYNILKGTLRCWIFSRKVKKRVLTMFNQTGSMTFPMTYEYNSDGFYFSKRSGWKSLSSLEKSLSVALGLVSVLAIALMIALIIVGVKLSK